MTTEPRPDHRIAKLLARAGVASRREIERMIADGRVALDGKVLDTPATLMKSLRGVTVDGVAIEAAAPARLFIYHKPPGLLVTEHDPAGRPTIYDRLPSDLPRVVPVGRLDLATEGLLLLTTDGALKRTLELPKTGVERAYRARAYGEITQAMLEELIEGVEIEGVRYGPIDANLERRTGANVWIELILTEGKNREVRRVLEHLGLQVSRLIRTRYGPFILGDLPAGGVGEVRQHDLVAFTKSLKDGGKTDIRVEAVEPRTATRSARVAEPAPSPRTTLSKERRPRPTPVTPDLFRGPAGGKQGGRGGAAPSTLEQGSPERSRSTRGDEGNARTSRAPRPDADPAKPPRPGFRTPRKPDSERSSRTQGDPRAKRTARAGDARPSRPADSDRPKRGEEPATGRSASRTRPPRSDTAPRTGSGERPPRKRDDASEARPGRTGPRAARPARAAREDARAGSAGGWPDRPAAGERGERPKAPPRGGARTDGPARPPRGPARPGGARPAPGAPRRPGGPPRGKR